MTRRRESPADSQNPELTDDDIEHKLSELRRLKQDLGDAVDPRGRAISVHSPGFIAFYIVTSIIIITGLVFYLKGYF
jgi:hypothetical protein